MTGKETARKTKAKDAKLAVDHGELQGDFSLPDSLPIDEIEYPVLIARKVTANWNEILEESERFHKSIEEYEESKKEPVLKAPFIRTEAEYIKNVVLVSLLPALEETLNKAKIWDVYSKEKCFFNGIDWIVQEQSADNGFVGQAQSIFGPTTPDIRTERIILFICSICPGPRQYYPKSWLWPEDYAATLIQKTVRQYFVQRDPEVQEMRDFWKKLKMERNMPQIDMNPLLARKFASTRSLHTKQ